ncbi:MAG TPA: redoxin domain-containing protein [Vicinamibacteria bacterium]|nr:redoxin domain-containing protein [Vicinamibacteria bacterium]
MNKKVLIGGLAAVAVLVGVLFANLGRDPHSIESPLIGRAAPPFVLLPAGGGTPVSLASLRGRPAVLNFWASWCLPCVDEHGVLLQAARALAPEVQFLGIVYEDEEVEVLKFLRQHGQAFPSLLDPEGRTAIAYGVAGVPETYFVDARGSIVAKYVGPLDPERLASLIGKFRSGT